MLATVVDLAALWKILAAVLLVGVGVTAVFGEGAAAAARLSTGRETSRARDVGVVVVAGLVCLAGLVVGFMAMTHK